MFNRSRRIINKLITDELKGLQGLDDLKATDKEQLKQKIEKIINDSLEGGVEIPNDFIVNVKGEEVRIEDVLESLVT